MIADILKIKNNDVCRFSNKDYSALLNGVFSLGEKNLILSSRVVTRGGLAISLCKTSFHNNVGIDAKIGEEAFDITLFNENLAIIIEVNNKNVAEAQKTLETNNIPFDIIGATSSKETIIVNNKVNLSIKEAKNVWDISLREKLLS